MASEAFEEIVANFELFDDWEERYRYVIELGKDMPPLDPAFQADAYKVDGCASQVWLVPDVTGEGGAARIAFEGDSDAMIVRGLISILRALYSGRTAGEIRATDAQAELARLGLDQALSAQRSNGLRAMVARINQIAERAEAG